MKLIAVNTRFLLKDKLEGIGWFTCESLRYITTQHPEYRFLFIFDRPYSNEFLFSDNIEAVYTYPPARHPFLWYMWFEWSIPRILAKYKPDLFLSMDGFCSLRTTVPTMTVIHDLAFEHYGEYVPFWVRHYYQHFTPKYAHKSVRLAAVSEYTKQDLVKQYGVNADKIDVVYNGANTEYKILTAAEKAQMEAEISDGQPYFLFIGAIHPRKNVANILRAYDAFRQQNDVACKFIIAGRKAWQTKEPMEVYEEMTFKEEVIFLGHVPLAKLKLILGAATALIFPSYFEGFGIPILEGFYCEVPVLTANVSSMPEVAGDAAILVDPYSVAAIADGMRALYFDKDLRKELIARSRVQRGRFSWEETGKRLWGGVERALGGGG